MDLQRSGRAAMEIKEEEEKSWCLLPDLVVWMIKDRLGFVDNTQMACVCRNWWHASTVYPNQPAAPKAYIMYPPEPDNDDELSCREFICVSTPTPTTMTNENCEKLTTEFVGAELVFSKRKWLLMKRKNSFFLIHLFTKVRINLPDVGSFGDFVGTFTFLDQQEHQPHRVFLYTNQHHKVWLRIAHIPGDKKWTEYNFVDHRIKSKSAKSVLAIGQKVFCFDFTGRLIIYDMVRNMWKMVDQPERWHVRCYMVEHQGEIFKYSSRGDRLQQSRPNFDCTFRYNDDSTAWERLSYNDVKDMDTSWFLSKFQGCFSAKGQGFNVYYFTKRTFDAKLQYAMMIHTTSRLCVSPYYFRRSPCWARLPGWVNLN